MRPETIIYVALLRHTWERTDQMNTFAVHYVHNGHGGTVTVQADDPDAARSAVRERYDGAIIRKVKAKRN